MRRAITRLFLLGSIAACGAGVGCTANIHDNKLDVENPKVSVNTSADVNAITPGQSVPLTLKADNVFLVDPKTTPPPEHMKDAGYFEIFLDDIDSQPLVVTASTSVSVTIPQGTSEGEHKLVCRLTAHDGTPTDSEQELMINVKASASASVTTTSKKRDGG